jgi:DNA-binding NarL/FixJ family response regulator
VSATTIRVLVADDHYAVRGGVRAALEGHGFAVCAEAADAAGAVEAAQRERPDIVLLDINMPGSGIRAAAKIAATVPDTTVVMLTVSRDDDDLFAALQAGASGYLLKDMDPARLADALHGVCAGEAALSRTLVGRVIEEFRHRQRRHPLRLSRDRAVELTEREWEVLQELRDGLTTQEIADALGIAPVTVRRHVSSTLAKLRVSSRAEALRLLDAER